MTLDNGRWIMLPVYLTQLWLHTPFNPLFRLRSVEKGKERRTIMSDNRIGASPVPAHA